MNTTHTPGPWTIHDNIGRKSELGIVADAAPCIIAVMGNQKHWPVEAEANAHLIAAAPELLQALEVLLKMVEDRDVTTVELDQARDAIAKARGEQVECERT